MTSPWTDREPDLNQARLWIGYLGRRAARRWPMVLGLALISMSLATGWAWTRPSSYTGRVVLRVTEQVDKDMGIRGWSNADLRDQVEFHALNDQALVDAFVKASGWKGPFDARDVIMDIREFTKIDVQQNHALGLMAPEDRPPSAFVSLTYESDDARYALALPRELAERVVAAKTQERFRGANAALRVAVEEERGAKVEVDDAERAFTMVSAMGSRDAAEDQRLTRAAAAVTRARAGLAATRLKRSEAEARIRRERERPGVDWVVAAERVQSSAPRAHVLAVVIPVSLVAALVIWAFLVAAFDPRIYALEDVARLGLKPLGILPIGTAARGTARARV
jgi:hypothetical protein